MISKVLLYREIQIYFIFGVADVMVSYCKSYLRKTFQNPIVSATFLTGTVTIIKTDTQGTRKGVM